MGRRSIWSSAAALAVSASTGWALALGAGAADALPPAQSFGYTGGEQTYVVPAGVARVDVTAIGAAGGVSCATPGLTAGLGGSQVAEVSVHGGEVLYVEVGGIGGGNPLAACNPGSTPAGNPGGFNGGGAGGTEDGAGGGGASDIRTVSMAAGPFSSLASRLVTAAGGGGTGDPGFGIGGFGGNAESSGAAGVEGFGGRGATSSTFGSGGAANFPGEPAGLDGQFGVGGAGSSSSCNFSGGGGGGGGYWGGGGGAPGCADGGGGGGGGSSFAAGPSIVNAVSPSTSAEAASVTIAPAAEATDTESLSALTFASTTVQTISGAQTATITNTGVVPVDVGSVAIIGADESDFLLTDETCTGSLAPDASCQATVRFAPEAIGQRTATLEFISDSVSSPDMVTLSGIGTPALASPFGGSSALTYPSSFPYPYVQVGHGNTIVVIAHLPGPGDFDVLVTSAKPASTASVPLPGKGRQTFAVLHNALTNGGRLVEELHPTYQGRQLMRHDARLHKRFSVTVSAIFTPFGGKPNRIDKSFTIRPVR
jgi:hypothetical protein